MIAKARWLNLIPIIVDELPKRYFKQRLGRAAFG